jgi:hypothetical protein
VAGSVASILAGDLLAQAHSFPLKAHGVSHNCDVYGSELSGYGLIDSAGRLIASARAETDDGINHGARTAFELLDQVGNPPRVRARAAENDQSVA